MAQQLHQLIYRQAQLRPDKTALRCREKAMNYRQLATDVDLLAGAMQAQGILPGSRCGVYLPKLQETVVASFAISAASAVLVPINPVLKAEQLVHIANDCAIEWLVTQRSRLKSLLTQLPALSSIDHIVLIDGCDGIDDTALSERGIILHDYTVLLNLAISAKDKTSSQDSDDVAAILYTSGSTGRPKGVVLSHRNILLGADSVSEYLHNTAEDKILAVLPLSFDYGFSQLTTAFLVGAEVVLLEYLLPRDVLKAVEKYHITGLAAVPPLWVQLAEMQWPKNSLRYMTNSGGHLHRSVLAALRQQLPTVAPYLMYGLTEAFRSTYLPPELIDVKPDSMGCVIPGAELWVADKQGHECAVGEVGELVHAGGLVAQGYWQDEQRTAERFKPLGALTGDHNRATELAVWSGDKVYRDADGFFYFVGRDDEMIKTSGYRVSPSEIESLLIDAALVDQIVVFGIADDRLGQKIVVVASGQSEQEALVKYCREHLPTYMQPAYWCLVASLPCNANGKLDRSRIARDFIHQQRE